MNRVETEIALNSGRARLLETYMSMDDKTLLSPVTESAFEPGFWWTPKDHFAHLIRGERAFCSIVSAFVDGHEDPIRAVAPKLGDGNESPIDYVNRGNDEFTKEHMHMTFSELVQLGEIARSDTFDLLARLTDEQFELQIPSAPWSGGTVGAVLAHNAQDHAEMHWNWMVSGWRALGVIVPAS
jgi:hypothetical protein